MVDLFLGYFCIWHMAALLTQTVAEANLYLQASETKTRAPEECFRYVTEYHKQHLFRSSGFVQRK